MRREPAGETARRPPGAATPRVEGRARPDGAPLDATSTIPLEERLSLLRAAPGLARLPEAVLQELAGLLEEAHYPAGATVVAEGDLGEQFYLVAAGRAEVSTAGPSGPVPLASLTVGEVFGHIALLDPERRRRATVTALTPLHLLALGAPVFRRVLEAHPDVRAAFANDAEAMLVTRFLKQASPFAALDAARARSLADRLERRTMAAGATVIRQGELGDACYLLRRGRVEVVRAEDGAERQLATLTPGALFGEAALLADAPRNATVRTLERCELLVLRRQDLLAELGADRRVSAQLLDLHRMRSRPRRVDGIITHERTTADGEVVTILKDPRRGAYYQLSPGGRFLWERLDGRHTFRDLTIDYLMAFDAFAPDTIAETVGGLARAGFVETAALGAEVRQAVYRVPGLQRALGTLRRALDWRVSVPHADGLFTRLYRGGGWLVYTRLGLAGLAAWVALGFCAFIAAGGAVAGTIARSGPSPLVLVAAYLCVVVLHEGAHGLTTKACGREVRGLGVGWYWFSPTFFVDTTDMWLADRRARIAVSLAGPCGNLLVGGTAAIAAWLTADPALAAMLWQFALVPYLGVLINLNPLLQYDGYYVLADLLDRPNLRPRALAWLGSGLLPALRGRGELKGHHLDLLYGVTSVLYVAVMAAITVAVYRLVLQDGLARVVPAEAAEAIAWVLAASVVALAGIGVLGDVRAPRSPAAT